MLCFRPASEFLAAAPVSSPLTNIPEGLGELNLGVICGVPLELVCRWEDASGVQLTSNSHGHHRLSKSLMSGRPSPSQPPCGRKMVLFNGLGSPQKGRCWLKRQSELSNQCHPD